MNIPAPLLRSLKNVEGFDEEAFLQAHNNAQSVVSIRINPVKNYDPEFQDISVSKVPWSEFGYYLDRRPSFTFDPLFHAGCYYVQEASSMFLEQAVKQLLDLSQPLKVLDLSAAPGGKSTHLQSLLSADSLLVSNDVIRPRAQILKQNIIKWGSGNVIVTNNDPQHFQKLPSFFDLIVVDAPCSGSGLFRKDAAAVEEWSPDNVALCQGRQKRILADILSSLKPGGILIYSTCSYSADENEHISDWLVEEHEMKPRPLSVVDDWGIVETHTANGATGYRFYPDKLKGEGFYLCCFEQTRGTLTTKKKKSISVDKLKPQEFSILEKWLDPAGLAFIRHGSSILSLSPALLESFTDIQSNLFIQYAGTLIGEQVRDKIIPDHALAVSTLISENISRVDVPYEEAIRYLQRAEMQIETKDKGWQLISYKGHSLGWINALQNRINNYYPKELRILKQRIEPDIDI